MSVIDIRKNKRPVVSLVNAVTGIHGVRQNPRGTVIEYWRGETDFEPEKDRKEIFDQANKLEQNGFCHLVQFRMGNGEYSYRAVLK